MEWKFALGRGGTLFVQEMGPRALFLCEVPDDKRGLYKAYLRGREGRSLLGTLMPENGRLKLQRTLAIDELERKRLWPVTGGEIELAYAFSGASPSAVRQGPTGWNREENPAHLMGDRVLSHAANELRGVLFCREAGGFALAVPYEEKMAFPMQPLFCFAHIERLQERPYAVFHFNAHGCPIFQNKENDAGNTDGANQKKE